MVDGAILGVLLGFAVGFLLGSCVGWDVGIADGLMLGFELGEEVGFWVIVVDLYCAVPVQTCPSSSASARTEVVVTNVLTWQMLISNVEERKRPKFDIRNIFFDSM